jgi:predicted amidophosphoribosyltransferase
VGLISALVSWQIARSRPVPAGQGTDGRKAAARRYCHACGKPAGEAKRFCPTCGAKLRDE